MISTYLIKLDFNLDFSRKPKAALFVSKIRAHFVTFSYYLKRKSSKLLVKQLRRY